MGILDSIKNGLSGLFRKKEEPVEDIEPPLEPEKAEEIVEAPKLPEKEFVQEIKPLKYKAACLKCSYKFNARRDWENNICPNCGSPEIREDNV